MSKFILAPGPTQCEPRFLEKLSEPVTYHRCEDFHKIYTETQDYLKQIIGLDGGYVFPLTCSGTGAMEASVANFFEAGDEVLVISVGHFGHRYQAICEAYNLDVHMLDYDLGTSYNYEEVEDFISFHPDLKGVFITYYETSSGVLNQLEPVGKLVADMEDCLFIVDGVSGLMVHPMEMSAWNIDCMVASSQKGFLIPPGIAVIAISNKAAGMLDRGHLPRYYNDLRTYIGYLDKQETPFTPNTGLIIAMHDACKYLLEDYGMENYYKHHEELCDYLCQQLEAHGYDTSFVAPQDRGSFLVMFAIGAGKDAREIKKQLDKRGYIVVTGFGDYASTHLRVGIVGAVTKEDIDKFLGALNEL